MSKKYELVNPLILGSFDRIFTADNSLQASHLAYQSLSQYFVGHIPKFKFTLQRVKSRYQTGGGKDSDFIHFEVYEQKSKESKQIEYAIKPLNTETNIDNFQQKLQNFMQRKKNNNILTSEESKHEQSGGRKYVPDDDDDVELDPDLEAMLYDDEQKYKKKYKKGKKWYALSGPLKGQEVYTDNPITYYRYDPVLYKENITYIPIFTQGAKPIRMVYDTLMIRGLI